MKILALDIARNTGFALGSSGGKPVSWSVDLGEAHERRFSKALEVTAKLIADHKPDLIAIENMVGRAKTPHVNVQIIGCVRGVAANRGVPVVMCEVPTVRKHFLGHNPTKRDFPGLGPSQARKAIKQLVMDRCRLLGWEAPDDDAADAVAIWDYACATHARGYQSKPVGGLF